MKKDHIYYRFPLLGLYIDFLRHMVRFKVDVLALYTVGLLPAWYFRLPEKKNFVPRDVESFS
jgi:hypothetical protein